MQTQKDLVMMHPRQGIMNIDVLSFGRLSTVFLKRWGRMKQPVLMIPAKSLVLRRIAGAAEGETAVIGGNLNKTGYIHEVKSAISEFMQCRIGVEELEKLTDFQKERSSCTISWKDLGVLYRGFQEFIHEKYITTEETLDLCPGSCRNPAWVKGSVIAFDGFTGFTPVQNRVLRQLMELAQEGIVTAVLDGSGDMYDEKEGRTCST